MRSASCRCKSGCTCRWRNHLGEGIKFVTEVRQGQQLSWRKSGRSNASGNCVEVARLPENGGVAIRNSRNPEGPALVFTADEIAAFVGGIRDGDFDDLVPDPPAGSSAASAGSSGNGRA